MYCGGDSRKSALRNNFLNKINPFDAPWAESRGLLRVDTESGIFFPRPKAEFERRRMYQFTLAATSPSLTLLFLKPFRKSAALRVSCTFSTLTLPINISL